MQRRNFAGARARSRTLRTLTRSHWQQSLMSFRFRSPTLVWTNVKLLKLLLLAKNARFGRTKSWSRRVIGPLIPTPFFLAGFELLTFQRVSASASFAMEHATSLVISTSLLAGHRWLAAKRSRTLRRFA